MITTDIVKHVAKLSRLEFTDNEIESLKEELNNIVGFVDEIQKVDTSGIKNVLHCVNAKTDLREDVPHQSFTKDQALSNAPSKKSGAFYVPLVVE